MKWKWILLILVLVSWGYGLYSAANNDLLGIALGGVGALGSVALLGLIENEREWRPHVRRWKRWKKRC